MAAGGEWNKGTSGSNQDSVFFNGTCYNCNKRGHQAKDCRQGRGSGRGGTSRGGHDTGHGRGGGRGRGGRGGRGGQSHGGDHNDGKDFKPPSPGEPKEQVKNGRQEKWCGV
jgi:Zinc knuckle